MHFLTLMGKVPSRRPRLAVAERVVHEIVSAVFSDGCLAAVILQKMSPVTALASVWIDILAGRGLPIRRHWRLPARYRHCR